MSLAQVLKHLQIYVKKFLLGRQSLKCPMFSQFQLAATPVLEQEFSGRSYNPKGLNQAVSVLHRLPASNAEAWPP